MTNVIIETTDGKHDVRSVNRFQELLDEFGERLARAIWWTNVYDYHEWKPEK